MGDTFLRALNTRNTKKRTILPSTCLLNSTAAPAFFKTPELGSALFSSYTWSLLQWRRTKWGSIYPDTSFTTPCKCPLLHYFEPCGQVVSHRRLGVHRQHQLCSVPYKSVTRSSRSSSTTSCVLYEVAPMRRIEHNQGTVVARQSYVWRFVLTIASLNAFSDRNMGSISTKKRPLKIMCRASRMTPINPVGQNARGERGIISIFGIWLRMPTCAPSERIIAINPLGITVP